MHSMYFDGASRSNPGPSSFGGVIYNNNNQEIINFKKYIGKNTNNVAEYMGCLGGIRLALENEITSLKVYGDSMLVVNQINGKWKVKSENLKPIYNEIKKYTPQFQFISFNHVYRKHNKRADALANEALDEEEL